MPAITADSLTLPRLRPVAPGSRPRGTAHVVTAHRQLEGAGFEVRRPFPSHDLALADPFLLLDQMGGVDNDLGPGEARGAPDHPHRGFETVTYMLDGALEHRDSTGGGGVIGDGGTQWMTAGAGLVHSEMPTNELYVRGGRMHGIQLWVNLPAAQKWTPPTYQDIDPGRVVLLAGADGASLVRLIAGDLDGHPGPGSTFTPITYAHASLPAGTRLEIGWRPDFNALVYVLAGRGRAGADGAPVVEGQMAVLEDGDHISLEADPIQDERSATLEVLLLGGRPIGEPVARYGPFVMTTREEIQQAVEDYQAGRMGRIPPKQA